MDESLIVPTKRFNRLDGAQAVQQLRALQEPPDAVFCYSHLVALGAVHVLVGGGLRVPEDVAIMG